MELTAEQIVNEIIPEYNLSIRRIPDKLYSLFDISNYREGDEKVFIQFDEGSRMFCSEETVSKMKENFYSKWPQGRPMCRRIIMHRFAGKYMVKTENTTYSQVTWDLRSGKVFMGDTLQEAIKKFLESLGK